MEEKFILIDYNYLAQRAGQLSNVISENQASDPNKKNVVKTEQNLINLGAIQMINEIIDNSTAIIKDK